MRVKTRGGIPIPSTIKMFWITSVNGIKKVIIYAVLRTHRGWNKTQRQLLIRCFFENLIRRIKHWPNW